MEENDYKKPKKTILVTHSIRFKLIISVIAGGIILMVSMLWLLSDSMTKVEKKLMDSRLAADIAYLRDELGENDETTWNIKDGALYIGDTLIGDGTIENANDATFFHCEKITGTFYYTFVRTDNDEELVYVESGGYQQGHYKRVAGTTKGTHGESIVGTYIDKVVADDLENSLKETGQGVYGGRANVNGRMIYCRYELLMSDDGDIAGVIVVGRSIEEMNDLLQRERVGGIGATIFVLLLICGGISVTISLMIAAIKKIKERLDVIGSGEFPDEPLCLNIKDELNDIAVSINSMVDSLKEKERIGTELGVASKIQISMLPCIFPAFPNRPEIDIFASMQPAKEVGGDFYDFFLVDDDHLALVIADVSGKGVPAALFMVVSKTLLKNSTLLGVSPQSVLESVNSQLCENNYEDMFVTVWLGILELSTGKLVCANAGHENPALCRKDGVYEIIKDKHSFILGGMDNIPFHEYEIQMNPGDKLFVYTDGVAEATNSNNELFGTDRMIKALNINPDYSPRELLPSVKTEIDKFVGDAPQFDDITMLGLHYFGKDGNKKD